jgi:hypothetical protein
VSTGRIMQPGQSPLERLAREILRAWCAGRDPAALQGVKVRTSTWAGLQPHDVVGSDRHPVQLPPRRVS